MSNAESIPRKERYRPLWGIGPFIAGVLAAVLIEYGILACGPPPTLSSDEYGMSFYLLEIGLVLAVLYVGTILLLLCCVPIPPRLVAPATIGAIGLFLAVFGVGAGSLVHLAASHWQSGNEGWGLLLILALDALVALAAPFLMIQWRRPTVAAPMVSRTPFRTRIVLAGILGFAAVAAAGQFAEARWRDRSCELLLSWVKATYPTPRPHLSIPVPPQLRRFTSGGLVDAVVLADGRVLVLMKTAVGWKGNWSGMIYCSGPIRASEIGANYYGRPQLLCPGFPEHYITKRIDDRRFAAAFDLN